MKCQIGCLIATIDTGENAECVETKTIGSKALHAGEKDAAC
jgi:hypothetical protein